MNQAPKIQSFNQLIAWQKGHALVLSIYDVTRSFPKEETYALIDQMHRCCVSVTSNIAEGFSRKSYKEKIQFYSTALGSITELQSQLFIAKDVGYIANDNYLVIENHTVEVHKLINGLIKGARKYTSKSFILNS